MKTIADIKQFYKDKGFIALPYTKEEINEGIKKLGKIPQLLHEYYLEVGEIVGHEWFYEYVITPENLYITTKEDLKDDGWKDQHDYLIIATEMQGTFEYAIALEDIEKENPPLYFCGEMLSEIDSGNLYHAYDEIKASGFDYLDDFDISNLMEMLSSIAYTAEKSERVVSEKNAEKVLKAVLQGKIEESFLNDIVLERLKDFEWIDLNKLGIKNISAMKKFPSQSSLIYLSFQKNKISDLTPIKHLTNLQGIILIDNEIKDINILKNFTKLKYLNLKGNPIDDITCLKDIKTLEFLSLTNTNVYDVSAIDLESIKVVSLVGTKVSDGLIEKYTPKFSQVSFDFKNGSLILEVGN